MQHSRLPLSIYLLSLCNAYLYICLSLLITISALIGYELATDKRLSTLPLALQFLSIVCGTVPASMIMGRIGRKRGFLLGNSLGILGASLALVAVFKHEFVIYCLATICFGLFSSFSNYYRFTAPEVVAEDQKSKAISMVMAGGVIAAFIGPNLANWSSALFDVSQFAGPFVVLIAVYLLSMVTVSLAKLPPPVQKSNGYSGRPTAVILKQPVFIVAVLCQMLGYATMNLVMTATPLAMHTHDYGMDSTALVIQWHVAAMFAPSFVTGHLIKRFGIVPVLIAGVALGLGCVAVNLSGSAVAHFTIALMLLGISWNFLFIGGTTLLTETYTDKEKSRAQATNDLLVFSIVSASALAAGTLHHLFGFQIVNLSVIPLLLITGIAVLWLAFAKNYRAAPALR